jgi:hypothetical protein
MYVIGTDGVIAYAEVNPDYTKRPDSFYRGKSATFGRSE